MKAKKQKKLKIGIDVDNVVADSYTIFLQEFNRKFGTKVQFEELVEFDYLKTIGFDAKVIDEFWDALLHSGKIQLDIPPLQNSHEIIKGWKRVGHSMYFVTARPIWIEQATKHWLSHHGILQENDMVFHFDEANHTADTLYKKEVVEKEGIEIFIEDSREIAQILTVPVFLLDMPWNQGTLASHITRVKNWDEIQQRVSKLITGKPFPL